MVSAAVEKPHGQDATKESAPRAFSRSERFLMGLIHTLRRSPLSLRSAIGYTGGFLFGFIPSRERLAVRLQLRAFFGPPTPFLVNRIFANAGRTSLESLNLKPILQNVDRHVVCSNWGEIEKWLADERPIVALTGHTGNWDLLGAYYIAKGIPITTVGKEAQNPAAQEVLRSIREEYGIETVWRSDRSGVKRLLECMRTRRTVAVLIDQDTRVDSVYAPFFGEMAKTPSAIVALAQKANARLVTAFMFRTGRARFETFIQELDSSKAPEQILTEYNHRLEALIRRFPDQWVWFHKRWRSRPNGECLSRRDYFAWLKSLPPRGASGQ
jgi:KDO2-lipid IV(A) lauroyltransferase